MITKGTIVEVFEDPLTMIRKEGNAKIMGHVMELEPGVNQYVVHFVGDADGFHVVRMISENGPLCVGTDPVRCDNPQCRVHGGQISAHWVKASDVHAEVK